MADSSPAKERKAEAHAQADGNGSMEAAPAPSASPSLGAQRRRSSSRTQSDSGRIERRAVPRTSVGDNSRSRNRARRGTILGVNRPDEFTQDDHQVVREALMREEALLKLEEEEAKKEQQLVLSLIEQRGADVSSQLGDLQLEDFVLLAEAQAAGLDASMLSNLAQAEYDASWASVEAQFQALSAEEQEKVLAQERAFQEIVSIKEKEWRLRETLHAEQLALERELEAILSAPLTAANVHTLALLAKTAQVVAPNPRGNAPSGWSSVRKASSAASSKATAIKAAKAAAVAMGKSRARFQRKKLTRPRSQSVDNGHVARKRQRAQPTGWAPPSPSDDVLKMPLSLALKFTQPTQAASFVFDEEGEELVSGSTQDLVHRLITLADKDFIRNFFLASAYIVPDETLLQLLALYYRAPPTRDAAEKKSIRENVMALFDVWIPLHYEFLKKNAAWIELFNRFAAYLKLGREPEAAEHASSLSKKWESRRFNSLLDSTPQKPRTATAPIIFTDVDPVEMARQLTLKEHFYFAAIPLREYYRTAWTKASAAQDTPNMLHMIERFNEVTFWVASTVLIDLSEEETDLSPKERAAIISYWIRVMRALEDLHNYNSAFQIFTALNMTPIQRLKKTWEAVPKQDMAMLEAFSQLVLSNYKGYRERLDAIVAEDGTASSPFVPIHSLVLRDLSMVEEMEIYNPDGSVYWEKIAMLGNAFTTIQSLRQCRYPYGEDAGVQALFGSLSRVTEDDLYSRADSINRSHSSPSKVQRKASSFFKSSGKDVRTKSSTKLVITTAEEADSSQPLSPSSTSSSTPAPPSPSPITRRDSITTIKQSLRRNRANSDTANEQVLSLTSPRAVEIAAGERKRSKSIRDFFKGSKKTSKDQLTVITAPPDRFAELVPGTEPYLAFREYLERKIAADLLDVLALIERIEEGDFQGDELAVACEGLCTRWLGLGDEPEEVSVEDFVLEQIKKDRKQPSRTMFAGLKRSIRMQLEDHYVRYLETVSPAGDLKRSTGSAKEFKTPRSGLSTSVGGDSLSPSLSLSRMSTSTPPPMSPGKDKVEKAHKTPRK